MRVISTVNSVAFRSAKKPATELTVDSMYDFTDVPASIYDRKIDVRPFATTHNILRYLSLVLSLLKGRNAPLAQAGINACETIGSRPVKILKKKIKNVSISFANFRFINIEKFGK